MAEDVEAVFATGGAHKCRRQALKVPGWVAVEPRENYPRLWSRKQAWLRMDPELEGTWSVTCCVVRTGQRQSGLTYELATPPALSMASRSAPASWRATRSSRLRARP